jgi:formylglycine-generating enzyme required for sulfatase activity
MTDQSTPETLEATPFEAITEPQRSQEKRLKPSAIGFVLIALCAGIFTWHLFTARAIAFNFTPQADDIQVSGWLSFVLGERYLVRPGTLTVSASAKGHIPIQRTLTISDAAEQNFEFEFERLPGQLEVLSQPAGADITIDGQVIGKTPYLIESISAGEHLVTLSAPRYVSLNASVEIKGMNETQRLKLDLTPAWGVVTLSSKPERTLLTVDGEASGELPLSIELVEGERALTFTAPGYEPKTTQITVTRGETLELEPFILKPAMAELTLNSDPQGALVSSNDDYLGTTPFYQRITPNQPFSFSLSKAGYESVTRSLRLKPAEIATQNIALKARLGEILLNISPESAEVAINGETLAPGLKAVKLPAKPQTFLISLEGYQSQRVAITPDPLLAQTLSVALLTTEAAKIAAIPKTISSSIGYQLQRVLPATIELGADRRDRGGRSNEIRRRVTLSQPYYLGMTEVTNAHYQQFDPSHNPGVLGRLLLTERNRPVVGISWSEAVAFCNWLSSQEGLPNAYERNGDEYQLVIPRNHGYRLPTEAEWSRAARYASLPANEAAGIEDTTRFPWGELLSPPTASVNLADTAATGFAPTLVPGYTDGFRGPSPSAHFPANALGIFDLAGNVAEWMHDRFGTARSPATAVDWTGPSQGNIYVIRGSSFLSGSFSELRWAHRDSGSEGRQDVGFRLARDISPELRP